MDRSQYNQCVEQYADRLFRFAFSSLRNREQAEDVVQESLTKSGTSNASLTLKSHYRPMRRLRKTPTPTSTKSCKKP